MDNHGKNNQSSKDIRFGDSLPPSSLKLPMPKVKPPKQPSKPENSGNLHNKICLVLILR